MSKNETLTSYSFKKGWNQVQKGDSKTVREKIMAALGITTSVNFYQRMRGKVEPKISEHLAIEQIFQSYGITDIWGE